MKESGKISFWVAVLMSVNIIVGAGIFVSPGSMTAAAGSISFLGWPLTALLFLPIVWCIAQAARLFPGEGGFYYYGSAGINPTAGFIAQWAYLIGYLGTATALCIVLRNKVVTQLGFAFAADHPLMFNALIVLFFSLLNLMNISYISRLQSGITLLKLLPLFFVITALAWYWNPGITYAIADFPKLTSTIPVAIFAYWGFESCCNLGHLLEGGPSRVGSVVMTAFFVTTAVYMFFHLGLLHIMGVANVASQEIARFPLFMGLSESTASMLVVCIGGAILLSVCNTIFGASLANIININMLAGKKLIFGKNLLTKTNRYGRPTMAVIIHGLVLWTFLCFITDKNVAFSLTNVGICIAFFVTVLAVLLACLRNRSYFNLAVAVIAFVSCGIASYLSWVALGDSLVDRLLSIAPLAAGLIVGLGMYAVQKRKTA
jgi:APA family basic amino acid/polyamine antiporter